MNDLATSSVRASDVSWRTRGTSNEAAGITTGAYGVGFTSGMTA